MYTAQQRDDIFQQTIHALAKSDLVEGIIQLGSGVNGYKDAYSDIDLMVATTHIDDAEAAKQFAYDTFEQLHPLYIKEKQFSRDIFLLIVVLENHLELNVSVVPRDFLTVRSPLWKVIIDKSGIISEKMHVEQKKFESQAVQYELHFDVLFEFFYSCVSFEKEIARQNSIYALKLLEQMREYTLIVQALNENKKLHQFKAYDTLEPAFIEQYIATYPREYTLNDLQQCARNIKALFTTALEKSTTITVDAKLKPLLQTMLNDER